MRNATMFDYPVTLTPDGDTVLVTFADVPEAITMIGRVMRLPKGIRANSRLSSKQNAALH